VRGKLERDQATGGSASTLDTSVCLLIKCAGDALDPPVWPWTLWSTSDFLIKHF